MFKRFVEWLTAHMPYAHRASFPVLGMPEVEVVPDIEAIFAHARQAAAGEDAPPPGPAARHVVVITPGRLLLFQPCPPPGSMPEHEVTAMEQLLSSQTRRKIAVIAYTELSAIQANLSRAIPFVGLLLGLAYIGHAVWVFEGHPTSLAAGCRDAQVVIVDSSMVPFLQPDWQAVVSGAMRHRSIYVHDRATFRLSPV